MAAAAAGRGGTTAAPAQKQEPAAQAALIEEKGGSVKNLTVEKKFQSPLRYPDKEGKKKVEENKMISVVRKEPTAARSETAARGRRRRGRPENGHFQRRRVGRSAEAAAAGATAPAAISRTPITSTCCATAFPPPGTARWSPRG